MEYIIGDIVMYNNKIMVIKELTDGRYFDLFCPKEELMYILVDVDEVKPIPLSTKILIDNEWFCEEKVLFAYTNVDLKSIGFHVIIEYLDNPPVFAVSYGIEKRHILYTGRYVHQLQHLLFGLGFNHEMKI